MGHLPFGEGSAGGAVLKLAKRNGARVSSVREHLGRVSCYSDLCPAILGASRHLEAARRTRGGVV